MIRVSFSLFLSFSFSLLLIFTKIILLFFFFNFFFHEKFFFYVPGFSGMFRVPGFIDARTTKCVCNIVFRFVLSVEHAVSGR